ncbi:hypothetical protein [Brasilonema sennae]|uniref:hypothetical protein n=1 Tax=Brasilonema sennae TaxID=1397703 RepID=UPI001C12E98B|nr:hypothetical protein [Brasilonema sennae]
MSKQANSIPPVDLVIVIDTSPSMKDEAQGLSNAAAAAIAKAKSSCPSDLRVVWLGIEGTWKGTSFDQTIRAYLTQKCKVSESKLRGRKKGQVADAGAQEDAARAIEDISDYFDWRSDATRAIFYLGDEALEGGGDKTDREDIKAADLAIQKAQAAGVTVHTYFGTSKSKHQESIKTEYARLATSTGGQSFTDKDAINGFSEVLEKVICGSRTAKTIKLKPGAVYIQDCVSNRLSKLYTLDLARGKATFIGEIVTEVSDIAFVGSQLYGLTRDGDKTRLVKIDLNSGDATVVGDIGFACAGLAYNRQRQTLYATTAKQLIAINLETGKGTLVFAVAGKDYNCGEVAFDADGKAYITLIGYNKKKLLASCNLDTGEVKTIGDIGFAALASMEFVGDVLYGVTGNFFKLGKDGQLIRIDTTTGKGTLVATTDPICRWAGITLYEPATVVTTKTTSEVNSPARVVTTQSTSEVNLPATVLTTQTASEVNSEEKSEKTKVSQEIKAINEEGMSVLTIDTKNNCYVINPDQMNNLQQNVATSFTFQKGTFDIRITSGHYRYAKAKKEGEPFVLLWIYGADGSTFINQNTGFEVGATWTTLNGYNDSLKLEVKQKAVLHALFFDVSNNDNSGSISLLITSNKAFFNPQTLTVDSKRNSYVLDENYLSSLKQSEGNFVELNPGNYRIKIREGSASYWSDSKKFNIEPWALLWVKGGKFITKLTGIEVEESWSSLNGLKDEVILEVKEKTTITGLFVDTYKEDNEGQIILAIEPVSAAELAEKKKQKTNTTSTTKTVTSQGQTTTTKTVTNIQSTGGPVSREPVGANSSSETVTNIQATGGSVSREPVGVNKFTIQINEAEYKQKLEERLQQISASFKVINENDAELEAKYWDQLEHWLLKNYEKHFKNLAIEVEKVRYTMDAYVEQMEFSVTQHLQDWSGYIDRLLQQRINVEISQRINQQISQYFDQNFEQKIRSNIGLIVNNILNKQELNQYIDRHVNQQIDQIFEQKIRSNIGLIVNSVLRKQELNQHIDQHVNGQIDQTFEQKIRNNVELIINNLVNQQQLNQYIDRHVDGQIDQTFEQKVRNNINLITQNIVNNNTDLDQYVSQQIDNTYEQKIRNHIPAITRNIVNNNEQLNQYFDQRLQHSVTNNTDVNNQIVNLVANSTEINNKISNLRNEWNQTFINLATQHVDELSNIVGGTDTFNRLIIQKIVNNNTDIDQYVSQQIDNTFEQKVQNNISAITRNIVNNNEQLNQYFDRRLQHSVTNNTDVNNQIVNLVANSTEIDNKISNLRNEWNQTFINLATRHVDELSNIIGGTDTFSRVITQKLVNHNADIDQYVSQQIDNTYEQKVQNNLHLITQKIVNNNEGLNQYIDRRLQHTVNNNTEVNNEIVNFVSNSPEINNKISNLRNEWNRTFINLATQHVNELSNIIGGTDTFNRLITQNLVNDNIELNQYISRQIDNTYEQKVQNNLHLITQKIVNNNEGLNQYIDRRLQQNVTNNIEINNEIVNFVVNSPEINNKINNVYRDIDIKIDNVRNEWSQTFINLVRQYVDQVINIIGDTDTFNTRIANIINIKVDDLVNQIITTKNELTVLMNNSDRQLYEWTLGELMAIKGCLTDREVLVEMLVTFSAELRTKLDGTACVDIKSVKPFKPALLQPKQ